MTADADGTCYVSIPTFTPTIKYGPAPYPQSPDGPPSPGTPCLVFFVGPTVGKPRVVALYPGATE